MTRQQTEQRTAADLLRELVKPGDTVWTNLQHVSRSGMYRAISLYVIEDNEPRRISYLVAKALGDRWDNQREAVGVSGCGMDMGFHLVNSLSYALHPEGFECVGDGDRNRCPSNNHSNGDRDYSPHWHKEGGFSLRHRWL